MWPLTKLSDELVTITINPSEISLGLIKPTKKASAPLELQSLRTIANKQITIDSVLYNPTALKNQITAFINSYNLNNAFVALCLTGAGVYERLVVLPKSNPQPSDFAHLKLGKLSFDYTYLYPTDTGQFVFYVAGMSRELLFQYQLLILQTSLHLVSITTNAHVLFTLYRSLYGTAFRQTQLAADMERSQCRLDLLFTPDMLHRLVNVRMGYAPEQFNHLLALTGLYIAEKGME